MIASDAFGHQVLASCSDFIYLPESSLEIQPVIKGAALLIVVLRVKLEQMSSLFQLAVCCPICRLLLSFRYALWCPTERRAPERRT